ncbi:MAG: type II toxin-antitoxin system ParD family antitoxin [Leptolyngbyaceae cyanobacterium]
MDISITLPPNLQAHLDAQIAAGVSPSIPDYLVQLLEKDYQRQQAQQKLNNLLQEGIDSTAQPVTSDYWQDLKQSVVGTD